MTWWVLSTPVSPPTSFPFILAPLAFLFLECVRLSYLPTCSSPGQSTWVPPFDPSSSPSMSPLCPLPLKEPLPSPPALPIHFLRILFCGAKVMLLFLMLPGVVLSTTALINYWLLVYQGNVYGVRAGICCLFPSSP